MNNSNIPMKNILIPINMILNIDFGILKIVQSEFNNKELINESIFNNCDNRIIYHILNRLHPNVLSLVINNHDRYNLYDLYDEIYNEYKLDILKISQFTDILNILIVGNNLSILNIDILCGDEIERSFLLERLSFLDCKFNTVIGDISTCDISKYDSIFINNIYSIKNDISRFEFKGLYIAKARYNLDVDKQGFKIPSFITDIIPEDIISIISLYSMDETFFKEGL